MSASALCAPPIDALREPLLDVDALVRENAALREELARVRRQLEACEFDRRAAVEQLARRSL